jgi:hypothetical protein
VTGKQNEGSAGKKKIKDKQNFLHHFLLVHVCANVVLALEFKLIVVL